VQKTARLLKKILGALPRSPYNPGKITAFIFGWVSCDARSGAF
jgi:hypothetical protein